MIRSSSWYFSNNSSQYLKKLGWGKQLSSRTIALSTVSKTQSNPLAMRRPPPRLTSAYVWKELERRVHTYQLTELVGLGSKESAGWGVVEETLGQFRLELARRE